MAHHLNIDGMHPATDPFRATTEVWDNDTDQLVFSGTAADAQLFADMFGGDLEFVTIQHQTRGFA